MFHDEFVALMSENMKRKIGNDLIIFPRKDNTTQLQKCIIFIDKSWPFQFSISFLVETLNEREDWWGTGNVGSSKTSGSRHIRIKLHLYLKFNDVNYKYSFQNFRLVYASLPVIKKVTTFKKSNSVRHYMYELSLFIKRQNESVDCWIHKRVGLKYYQYRNNKTW